jgi:SH3-like domain-containing protein
MRKSLFLILLWLGSLAVPGWASMKSIAKDNVNVRSRPNLQADVVFQAPLGHPVDIIRQEGSWLFLKDWQGSTGWVYRPLVSDIHTAVVLVDNANIRSAPGLKNRVVGQADRGEIYRIFEEKGNWVQIGYYFEREVIGWIRQDLVWGD